MKGRDSSYLSVVVANLLFGYLIDRFDRWKVMKVLLALIIVSALSMTIDNLLAFGGNTGLGQNDPASPVPETQGRAIA